MKMEKIKEKSGVIVISIIVFLVLATALQMLNANFDQEISSNQINSSTAPDLQISTGQIVDGHVELRIRNNDREKTINVENLDLKADNEAIKEINYTVKSLNYKDTSVINTFQNYDENIYFEVYYKDNLLDDYNCIYEENAINC